MTRRRRRSDDEQTADRPANPAAVAADLGGQAHLSVKGMDRRLRIGHDRLDLDHEQRCRRPVERQDVDRAPLAAYRERSLDDRFPANVLKPKDNLFDESRVSRVEESIQTLAMPPDADVKGCSKALDHPAKDSQLGILDLARLELRDHLPRDPREIRDINLPKAPTYPQCPTAAPDADRVHAWSMVVAAHPAINRAGSRWCAGSSVQLQLNAIERGVMRRPAPRHPHTPFRVAVSTSKPFELGAGAGTTSVAPPGVATGMNDARGGAVRHTGR
jgi:hypothetical protein